MKSKAAIKREAIKADIERLGLSCVKEGNVWRVSGLGVDILTCDLQYIEPKQLQPATRALDQQ